MKRKNSARAAAIATVTAALLLGGSGAAHAVTEYPEGGVWTYGVYEPGSTPYAYSTYKHSYKTHGSSVRTTSGILYRSPDKAPGQTAHVEEATGYLNNKFFYRVNG
ncbi:lactococcin 972 family bacteriocin [Agromyces atrinae]|uniref:Lactococcin 972 family bacteriocin n=1 Tax=Agromyces atrinae TaxID=592376 RepID=A0A4Q2M689_9MICO|nr:lactococcin 972 family bacteriocin [Agromyces atrinae]NYD67356.1 lactococcin 972 family bacteriocin [Agromyces atrinae]RXZ86817.1 hypothetical protein ESP50_07055 [Agromyces atrinae]